MNTLTILLPCLNEAETLLVCIQKAKSSLKDLGINGEIIVADNGSTDGSQAIAVSEGVKVINVSRIGYGAAIISGINHSSSKYIIMGYADDSYALDDLGRFVNELENGSDLVMGNRFKGGISPGAMPFLHRYLGNPILSYLGRLMFKVKIGDFHCGLRAFKTESIRRLNLRSTGMEFASEMVVKASLNGLNITEVPTTLRPDGRSRAPHLRTWRDGWRHLIFLFAASPRFLFLYPSFFLFIFGFTGFLLTLSGPIDLFDFFLDLNSYLFSIGFMIVGLQIFLLSLLARIFSSKFGMLPKTTTISKFEDWFKLERGIAIGILFVFCSLLGFTYLLSSWTGDGFDKFTTSESLRISGVIIFSLLSGIQILFASFFASILQTDSL